MKTNAVQALLDVMEKLRDPETGCVWDKKQTYQSILPYTIEETYEVVEAIETGNLDDLPSELGDLLFQVVFYSQIAKEEGRFDFYDVCDKITKKMIRRHPHVFAREFSDVNIKTVEEQSRLWEAIKAEEKYELDAGSIGIDDQVVDERITNTSLLDGVNVHEPALAVANNLQKKAAKTGYDWPDYHGPLAKIDEELAEVKQAILSNDEASMKDELGDLLFSVVNLSRHLKIDPSEALRHANRKFIRRFKGMEGFSEKDGKAFQDLSLDEMEAYWRRVKQETEVSSK